MHYYYCFSYCDCFHTECGVPANELVVDAPSNIDPASVRPRGRVFVTEPAVGDMRVIAKNKKRKYANG